MVFVGLKIYTYVYIKINIMTLQSEVRQKNMKNVVQQSGCLKRNDFRMFFWYQTMKEEEKLKFMLTDTLMAHLFWLPCQWTHWTVYFGFSNGWKLKFPVILSERKGVRPDSAIIQTETGMWNYGRWSQHCTINVVVVKVDKNRGWRQSSQPSGQSEDSFILDTLPVQISPNNHSQTLSLALILLIYI